MSKGGFLGASFCTPNGAADFWKWWGWGDGKPHPGARTPPRLGRGILPVRNPAPAIRAGGQKMPGGWVFAGVVYLEAD
jgi:hypothetical protein